MELRWYPSCNFGARKHHAVPRLVVLHYTAMSSVEGALKVLCDPDCEVSAHFVIAPDGAVFQLVEETARAWHAGAGAWREITDVNSNSIGIELCNDGYSPFAARQMDALETLLRGILERWHIPPEGVIGHSDLAPGRKIDPGPRFDWSRLARQGLAQQVDPVPARDGFDGLIRAAGYTAEASEAQLLDALRLRHRPTARERPLQREDLEILQALADARLDGARARV